MLWSDIMKIPEKIRVMFDTVPVMALATVDDEAMPNVVAVASKRLVNDNTIWISDSYLGKTLENVQANGKVAIAMWIPPEGYQIKGVGYYHTDGEIYDLAKEWVTDLWIKKGKKVKKVKGIIEVRISEVYSISANYQEAGLKLL